MLVSWPPRVFAAVSAAMITHRPCHLACLITLYSSTCISPAVLIHRRLHHLTSLPPPSLLFYISSASLLSLFLLYWVSSAVTLPSWNPAPSQPPVNNDQRNQGSWAPCPGRLVVCVPIRGTQQPFRSCNIPSSYHPTDVPILGTPYTHNRVCYGSRTPRFFILGASHFF